MKKPPFKPIKAPKRKPRPAPPLIATAPTDMEVLRARRILRNSLVRDRWDDQGGYSSFHDGKWMFASTSIGQFTPEEMNALFAFAGVVPDEIEVVGTCADCANSDGGYERGYAAPCSSCLRPSHINGFVPRDNLTKRSKSR